MSYKNEIVGVRIREQLYTGELAMRMINEYGMYDQLISREEARIMVLAKIQGIWESLLKQPTIFTLEDTQHEIVMKRSKL